MTTPDTADRCWHCPAVGAVIDGGLCWEYCLADSGGPIDTRKFLQKWIATSGRFAGLEDFHSVCASCPHCQWTSQAKS
ncbi:MAG: hypothetical protein IPL39_06185 [Opitutaceae bacterium]|nr:hypothetical protein [Opitutaceae bacterium]